MPLFFTSKLFDSLYICNMNPVGYYMLFPLIRFDYSLTFDLESFFSNARRRSQDFVWGAIFSQKSWRPFFSPRPLKDRLNIPPNLSHQAKTVLKLTLALAGGALSHFSCKLDLKKIFFTALGCRCTRCPLATPMAMPTHKRNICAKLH